MLSASTRTICVYLPIALLMDLFLCKVAFSDGWDPTTRATNQNSIVNTRHNLTQSYALMGTFMDYARNDYGQVCVYCHTPHGANQQTNAPLWNRTLNTGIYQIYDLGLTSGQNVSQPGDASLTCLSCHDGTIAIDSVINMPGSGGYSKSQETSQDNAFLSSWSNRSGIAVIDHGVIWSPDSAAFTGPYNCNRCHIENISIGVADFKPFYLGTDLINDHPIGVTIPAASQYDFRVTTGLVPNQFEFFDNNGNGKADTNELRLYFDGSAGYRIECATCHDPHGVAPSSGAEMYPSFLRKSNANSELCLSCHVK